MLGIFWPNEGEILTVVKNHSMEIRRSHYPIKLSQIRMVVIKLSTI
jgi:hypothetical protein